MPYQLINYLLHLADTALIFTQRNSEWCGHGPVLEQDIAITNISLDQLGQSRNIYQYAAELINQSAGHPLKPATEDSLAYMRSEREYKNLLLAELPRGDWAQTVLKEFFYSVYQYLLFERLQKSTDSQVAAIAVKSLKEVTYHLRWSSEWVIRLGDGTEESHQRMLNALEEVWPYTGEMFMPAEYELATGDAGIDPSTLKNDWKNKVNEVFAEATLTLPAENIFMHSGGKNGLHTEHMGYLLSDLQYMQRAYPNASW
ncbi:MAG: 1,2-phenylacetyl-CoA epoxidase subunit PaaC [Ferruginibacter sp.]